jgi:hypothetical protein
MAKALTALFFALPLSLNDAIISRHDADGNPRAPTSTGKFHVCHPACLKSDKMSSYFTRFRLWASWQRVSHGTVNSTNSQLFSKIRGAFGLCVVSTIGGEYQFLP